MRPNVVHGLNFGDVEARRNLTNIVGLTFTTQLGKNVVKHSAILQ